jgi:hypothetical protein
MMFTGIDYNQNRQMKEARQRSEQLLNEYLLRIADQSKMTPYHWELFMKLKR